MYLPVLVLFLFSIISCSNSSKNKSRQKSQSAVQLTDSSYVIIPFDEKQTYLFRNARPTVLSADEMKAIEFLLNEAVTQFNKGVSGDGQIKPLKEYKKQYVPIINAKGEKEVWVNCFCSDNNLITESWRTELVMVDDGGSCFFSVKINLSAKKTYDLIVNGIA